MITLKSEILVYTLKSILFSLIASFILVLPFTALAQDATFNPQLLTTSINTAGTTNSLISGSVSLNNNTDRGFDNYHLVVKLLSPGRAAGSGATRTGPALVINFDKLGPFSIKPGQSQNQSFELNYPSTVTPGTYLLTVEVIDQDSSSQSIASTNITLNGSGSFLSIDPSSCKITVDGVVYDYYEGPNIKPSQTVSSSCVVNNPTSRSISANSHLHYAVNSVSLNSDTSKVVEAGQVAIAPGQNKTVTFNLPANLSPQVYEGLFYLTDLSGEKISSSIPFRWINTGPSATIYDLDLDRSYYPKGSTAKLSIGITPSADLSWRGTESPLSPDQGTNIENAKLSLKITDKSGQLCSQSTQNLPSTTEDSSWSNLVFDMNIDQDCLDPIVEASLAGNGETEPLAEKKLSIRSTNADLKAANSSLSILQAYWAWILIGILAIACVGGAIYYLKFRKKQPPPVNGPPSISSAAPIVALVAACSSVLAVAGYLTGGTEIELLKKIPISIVHAQEVAKQPINSSDANTKNITVKSTWGGDRLSSWASFWGNARDFRQNNTGGDSEITVEPDCSKINITIKGTAGSDFTCYNWAPGLTVFPFIDDGSVKPENPTSPIGNEIWDTPYNFSNSNNFSIMQFDSNGQRQATFSITPNTAQSADGKHTLTLQVGVSHIVKHDRVEHFQSSFIDTNDCGGVPCYMLLKHDYTCRQPLACNAPCTNKDECAGNKDGCIECRPASGGTATGSGTLMTCQPPPPPACNAFCSNNTDCTRNTEGCSECVAGQCRIPPACNVSCTKDGQCEGSKDGCTSCLPSDTGTGTVCRPPAACNVACANDNQCSKAADGCTACVDGACKVPPACGSACTTKAECSSTKDGCSECLEGSCTDYNDNMCKCDGMVAEMNYPNNFNFEAFGKVEGSDTAKAEIADITFRLTKDNQVVAKSNPITPEVVESSANKLRFKAAWQTAPPAVSKGSTYRVFADVRCKPKRIVASGKDSFSPVSKAQVVQSPSQPPKGLEFAFRGINQLFGNSNVQVKAVTDKLLAMFSTSTVNAQGSNLQLQTLNFVKLMDTDNCRFVMFKYDESLF